MNMNSILKEKVEKQVKYARTQLILYIIQIALAIFLASSITKLLTGA
jgi:hypothetical protein